jgi:hypothetical protein
MILAAAIILILMLIFTCILVVPFSILLKLNVRGLKINGNFKLTWMKIRLVQKKFPEKSKEKKKPERKEKEEDKKQKFDIERLPKIISLIYESSPYLIRIFSAFLKSTRFEKLSFKLTLGLGSPYDTAIISGYLYALMPLLNLIPNACFSLEPDLLNERLEATVNLKISIRLLWIVIESLRVVIKKPVRSLLNEFRKMR